MTAGKCRQAYTSSHKIRGGQKSAGDCRRPQADVSKVWDVTAIWRTLGVGLTVSDGGAVKCSYKLKGWLK